LVAAEHPREIAIDTEASIIRIITPSPSGLWDRNGLRHAPGNLHFNMGLEKTQCKAWMRACSQGHRCLQLTGAIQPDGA